MTDLDLDEFDHYQAADDAYQGAYRLGVDRAECLELAVDVARKPLLAELERWRTGHRTRSIRPPASVPDGLEYAAQLVRSQGTEGGDAHDALLRAASSRLHALHDVASQQQDEVERLKARYQQVSKAMDAQTAHHQAEVEELQANQLPDGGEWQTVTGELDADGRFWQSSRGIQWRTDTHQRRIWTSPAEPIAEASG